MRMCRKTSTPATTPTAASTAMAMIKPAHQGKSFPFDPRELPALPPAVPPPAAGDGDELATVVCCDEVVADGELGPVEDENGEGIDVGFAVVTDAIKLDEKHDFGLVAVGIAVGVPGTEEGVVGGAAARARLRTATG